MTCALEMVCAGRTDKEWHGYLPHYEHHLDPGQIRILTEIGVAAGGSLLMWHEWMPEARVIGIEIDPEVVTHPIEPPVELVIGDATQIEPWFTDVLIDDGSHHGDDQLATFVKWWPFVRRGGWYVIEDLRTLWDPEYREGPMVEMLLSGLVGQALTQVWPQGDPGVEEFHAYEEIVFLKKAKH